MLSYFKTAAVYSKNYFSRNSAKLISLLLLFCTSVARSDISVGLIAVIQ